MGIFAVSATFAWDFPAFELDFGCCFGDFCGFSYFLPEIFQLLSWILGAVLGIFAVSATFAWDFPAFELDFGCCFGDFSGFSYFFWGFSGCWAEFGVLF